MWKKKTGGHGRLDTALHHGFDCCGDEADHRILVSVPPLLRLTQRLNRQTDSAVGCRRLVVTEVSMSCRDATALDASHDRW